MTVDDPEATDGGLTAIGPSLWSTSAGSSDVTTVDVAAFSDFYRSFTPTLVGFLIWQGVPVRHAADLAQETMIQAYHHWASIQSPPAWARRVASRLWVRRVAAIEEDPVAQVPESTILRDDVDLIAWERRHDILRALQHLPLRQRQVLAWALNDYTPQEIATELQMTPDAVRSSLYQARNRIARYLTDGDNSE